jgi:hypothetical protein
LRRMSRTIASGARHTLANCASDGFPPASAGGFLPAFWNGRIVIFSIRSLHMRRPGWCEGIFSELSHQRCFFGSLVMFNTQFLSHDIVKVSTRT